MKLKPDYIVGLFDGDGSLGIDIIKHIFRSAQISKANQVTLCKGGA
jgi:hypothetical protein